MEDIILRNQEAAGYIYAAKKNFIMENTLSESHSKVLIGHISDIHSDIKRFENAIKYFEYFGVDFAVHTGDNVKWNMSDNYKFFEELTKKSNIPFYNCIGNHDTFDNEGRLSNQEIDKRLISHQKNIVGEGEGYYYADFDKYALRLIVLNDYDDEGDKYAIFQPQCDWLVKALKGAAEKDYGVIIASHETDIMLPAGSNDSGFCQRFHPHPWGEPQKHPHIVADIVDSFKHGKELKLDIKWASGEEVHLDDRFDKQGEFICYLSGHYHGDYVGYLPKFTDQLSIGMTCSGCFPEGYHNIGEEISDLPRIPDTISEDAVNFYTIDRQKKTISIVRLGATVTDEFKVRRAVTLHY